MAKDTQVTVRVDAELVERADALAEQLKGISSRTALLRRAMELGFPLLEEEYRKLQAAGRSKRRS